MHTTFTRVMTDGVSRSAAGVVVALGLFLSLAGLGPAGPSPRALAQESCTSAMDVMLLLDGSESISQGEFDTMKLFATRLVQHFTISPDDARAGVVQFAGEGQGIVETGLSGDLAAIEAAISGMVQIVGATDIQEGIALGQAQLSVAGRQDVPHVMIVLTDGAHNQPGDPLAEAEAARLLGTEIFAVAVGPGPDIDQLNTIASEPAAEHVLLVSDFAALARILEPLVQVVCPPTPTAPSPTSTAAPPPEPLASPPAVPSQETTVLSAPGLPAAPRVIRLPNTGAGFSTHEAGDVLATGQRSVRLAIEALSGLGAAFLLSYGVATWRALSRREGPNAPWPSDL